MIGSRLTANLADGEMTYKRSLKERIELKETNSFSTWRHLYYIYRGTPAQYKQLMKTFASKETVKKHDVISGTAISCTYFRHTYAESEAGRT